MGIGGVGTNLRKFALFFSVTITCKHPFILLLGSVHNRSLRFSADAIVVRSVRLWLIPLDGTAWIWDYFWQPWSPVGCLVSHPHVIVTNSTCPETPSEYDVFMYGTPICLVVGDEIR